MFSKTALLTVALALMASASPLPPKNGVAVPFTKRSSSMKNTDGTFNADRAMIASARTINKHRANLLNLEKNVGPHVFKEGAFIKELAVLPSHLIKRQSEPLTNIDDDIEWAGAVSIGTPAQNFFIDFDTGSSDLWVPSASCNSTTCASKSRYTASSSSTSAKKNGTFSIQYGDGSTVSGPIFTDTVSVAGVSATKQHFSPVTTLSTSFNDDPIDGILGLAFPALSSMNQDPFFFSAVAQRAVRAGELGFKLATNGSELYLGGTNPALFSGALEYHGVDASAGFWQIGAARAFVGGAAAVAGFDTVIDSGTTIMYGPPDAVKAFYGAVPGAGVHDRAQGFYHYPCGSLPKISFAWHGGKKWEVTEENFNLGETKSGSGKCVGALAGQDIGLGSSVWLLGDSFMKNVYTAFSTDKKAVGFAALA
ncbi:acid protease [Epithele typhae]|uniref:acid protease n=1 Tax=Epithele typhae TaxID=378194 RepID=UPI00200894FD|nr:acid protease [Epithele typhae]KAH9933170.1 acid protease [Epithele typhae]